MPSAWSPAWHAGRLGIPIQVNTLVAEETVADLLAIYELLPTSFPVMRWSLFFLISFLISVGRGKALNEVSPAEGERIMNWVLDLVPHAPFAAKTAEAPSYRRLAIDKMRTENMPVPEMKNTSVYKGFQIRDGHGIVFVSNFGDTYPWGFLPPQRTQEFAGRGLSQFGNLPHAPLPRPFPRKRRRLRVQPHCGGSCARAFAHSGDAFGTDPFCPYAPSTARPPCRIRIRQP